MQAANAYFRTGASQHLVLHRYKLWLLADADLLSTRNSYRLCNTGCVATRALLVSCPLVDVLLWHICSQGLNRVQSCPAVGAEMSSILQDVQRRCGRYGYFHFLIRE